MDWVKNADAIWGILGLAIGSVIFFFVNRKVLALQSVAAVNLAKILKDQCAALTLERDDYRMKLHNEKDQHQATQLKLKEMEARPDLTSLTILLSDQKEWMRALGNSLKEHSESDAKIFGKIESSLGIIAEHLQSATNGHSR